MELSFLFLITLCLFVFLYALLVPVIRLLRQDRNQRRFSEETLTNAEEMFPFSDGDFVIMVYHESENKYFRRHAGEENEGRNSPGR